MMNLLKELLLFAVIMTLSCANAYPEKLNYPNIILITLDTTRADHLECYGYKIKTMPFLCNLAEKKGLIYENAFSASPLTLPAHTSILTGLDVHNHYMLDNGLFRLKKDIITLPDILKKNGYNTYAYISAAVLDRTYGLDKGFDLYDDNVRMGKREFFNYKERAASQVIDVVEKNMKNWKKPWFVWIHFYDPHDPYVPPQPFDSMYSNPYDGEIAFVDSQIKRLFELLEKNNSWNENNDWAFFIGDHGEDLGDFGEEKHGILITPATVHVPFIIIAPGKNGKRIDTPISITDFAPTILGILNLKKNNLTPAMDGFDFFSNSRRTKPIFITTMMPLFSFRWSPLIAALDYPFILIRGSKDELFNLQSDRFYKDNLLGKEKKLIAKLSPPLNKIKGNLIKHMNPDINNLEGIENIRSLGYVGSISKNMPKDPFSLPDAREKSHIYKEYFHSAKLVTNQQWQEALKISLALEKEDPYNTLLLNRLASIYEHLGDLKKSEEILLKVKSLIPDMDYPYFHLGQFYMRHNNFEQAKKYYQIALQKNPRYADVYLDLFQIAMSQRNEAEAYSILKSAISNKVKDVDLCLYFAIFSRNNKKYNDALNSINDAILLNPIDERLQIEKINILCKPDSPFNDKCLSFFKSLPYQANQIAEPWVAVAEFLANQNRLQESLFCWQEALKRPSMHDDLPNIIRQQINLLKNKNITPSPIKFD